MPIEQEQSDYNNISCSPLLIYRGMWSAHDIYRNGEHFRDVICKVDQQMLLTTCHAWCHDTQITPLHEYTQQILMKEKLEKKHTGFSVLI